ncbi:MAG: hypothetical protein INQ03_21145 [Candidatus Heimdallarchaeota archaeon]|nr:hypothetical protein [Candidatus Heimdallarchaeota archaeon]
MIPDDFDEVIEKTKIESWYPSVERYTIPTWFVSLTLHQVELLIAQYEYYQELEEFDLTDPALQDLIRTIDKLEGVDFEAGIFVRLSTRSPKDSKIALVKGKQVLENHSDLINENQKTILQMEAHKTALKVHSGEEAIQILCSSTRVYDDLKEAVEKHSPGKLIIRQWKEMRLEHEFRGFVYDNTLTALTQYFHYCYFPGLKDKMGDIQRRVTKLFEEFKDKVDMDNYIIDFVVTEKDAYLVEFNPFLYGAAEPGLFSWKQDYNLLKHGPFEFRIRESSLEK